MSDLFLKKSIATGSSGSSFMDTDMVSWPRQAFTEYACCPHAIPELLLCNSCSAALPYDDLTGNTGVYTK